MREIQEKAIRIALQCYGNGCLSDEDFINLLKAIFDKDLTNKFDLNPRLTNPITNPITDPRFTESRPKLTTIITDTGGTNTFENAR